MLARMVTSARLLGWRGWAAYAVFAAAVITVGLVWYPHMVGFGSFLVIANLFIRLATPARPPTRHRSKKPGTKHLAE